MRTMILAGGSGFIGRSVSRYFCSRGWKIYILSRTQHVDEENIHFVKWDGKTFGYWTRYIDEADVVINLAGRSVNCRYTNANKEEIYDSRINSAYILGKAIEASPSPPELWINSSSATIYEHSFVPMSESSGIIGNGFSVDVCKKWERTADIFKLSDTRKITMRTAIVLGENGGVLEPFKYMVKRGFGGKQGNGDQYFSWIHEEDLARIIEFCVTNKSVEGIINVAAPEPVTNSELMFLLRKKINMPIGIPAPEWLLKLGAALIGTETELLLKSRYVIPDRLDKYGYTFKYSTLSTAIGELLP